MDDLREIGPGVFEGGTPGSPNAALRRITTYALRQRLTLQERVAIELAGLDDPAAPMEQRQQSAAVRVMLGDLAQAQYIDLDDPALAVGVALIEAVGALSPARIDEILGAAVQEWERP